MTMHFAKPGTGEPRPIVESVLKVLVVHDDSVMSEMLTTELGSAEIVVEAAAAESLDETTLRSRCADSDAVLCVSTGWDEQTAERELRQLEVVIAALDGTAKRLLYVSESMVIGDTGDGFGNEDSPRSSKAPHPWRVLAERMVADAVSMGIHSVIVRPALVHGRGSGALLQRLVRRAANSSESVYIDDGSARISTVHVDDVIALIRNSIVRAPQGAIYVAASDEVMSWRDLADAVARTTTGQCEVESISEDEASRAGLDTATLTMSNVVRDHSAYRRFGWRPTGPTLVSEAMTSAR
jgi:nucleoside-diphosphate-sugar epimerase